MKLTESRLRRIIREELSRIAERKPRGKNVAGSTKKNVRSSFPSAEDGKVYAYDQESDKVQQVTPKTAEEKDKYRKPKPEELKNESVSRKLKKIVREELAKIARKQQLSEGEAFKADKMRELVRREPHLQQIAQSEGLNLNSDADLMELWRREVERNKRLKRKYKQASPQP